MKVNFNDLLRYCFLIVFLATQISIASPTHQFGGNTNATSNKNQSIENNQGQVQELAAESEVKNSNRYLSRLAKFRSDLKTQIQKVFIPKVQKSTHISSELKAKISETALNFSVVLDERVRQFGLDYKERFINYNKDLKVKERLLVGEANIKWAVERSLNAMIEILNKVSSHKTPSQDELEKHLKVIEKNGADIANNVEIQPSLNDTILKVTPVKTGLFRTVLSAAARMIVNQDLSKIIREIPTRPFKRSADQKAQIVFMDQNGNEVSGFHLPDDAAIVIGMNHDNASLDGMYLQEVAQILKVDRNLLLTTKDAWPHITALAKLGIEQKDPNILFKQDEALKNKVIKAFQDQKTGRISFSIFPEGELPFWHTQFPLFTNFGAFNIARSAAVALKGDRPVYYVEVMSNFLRATTSKESTPVRIEIYTPELVPTHDLVGDRDEWVEQRREKFEERANSEERRGQMVDLNALQKIADDGRVYVTDFVADPDADKKEIDTANIRSCRGLF